MTRCILMLIGTITVTVSAADLKPAPAELEKKFFRSWLAIESIEDGKSITDPVKLNGQRFSKDGSWCWGRRGELAPGPGDMAPRIDVTARPMRVDFPAVMPGKPGRAEQTKILPCIFKFDGGNLVVAYSKGWVNERKLKAGEDYEGRPTEFKSTKENGVTVEIMRPCAYLDQD